MFRIKDKTQYLTQIEEVIARGPYHDTWDSLTDFEMPSWFSKAKFGIFLHWGLYSVPAFSNEWYSRNMYVKDSPEYKHHIRTYGKHTKFGYKDFIPLFTAERFDPDFWAGTFATAGAKYVVPVFGASSHRAEHHWFMGPGRDFESDIQDPLSCGDFYWPSEQQQPDFQDLYAKPYPDRAFLEDWLCRTCEIVDRYQPRILYFDWWIQHEAYKPYLRRFAAYYYNRGLELGFPAAICYKHDAMAFGSAIVDVERGKFADTRPYYWQTDTAIARNSWCYTDSLDYKSSNELICYLIDVVSKNGNLLLNVGPKADGTFAEQDAEILRDIGRWLAINKEAVYSAKPWRIPAEGPTVEVEGQFSDASATAYTKEDFRFTAGNGCISFLSTPKIKI